MDNEIKPLFSDCVNLNEIGKYNKFIDFKKNQIFTHFNTDYLNILKLREMDRFLAMENMQKALDTIIEKELQNNVKLQSKIKEIQEKAKKRIEKLLEKPTNKIKEKYGYKVYETYFEPKLDSEEAFLDPC